ncbi:autotransporter outer membrane beta-barrel domain-containing protein [Pseudomonas sp. CCI3.2]|uniref:autotransporter family protein n=1 Tax=unclassified Pseudomonas TaxID=196821 RepID=UPI002AC8E8F2|nr:MULTISPECIES: autotransporter outer membrane beta-barrel domain-containing protein [unclassified Pseudomonas]MEB0077679.1 autotransporter outer membrane beta-barrel domain-containing protein [Pseudomonas sp. MH10out]MEB0101327.1 autotransporter outer membrane beta-barrel domain-containing protein [Pseudomonas sp. CCI3.2]MEB0131434.1 autotransporter outer membrane beta-barrel domain-containing protein [Pseudomonas sp. CCI2.4]MEB0158444.1 autotransporter outer membrane beta-barrel domain-conta
MDSGKILGLVDQGDGANVFKISAGTVSGDVSQGSGVDNFQMTGGTIASLTQGDSRDVFVMTGGTIVGGFDDGDIAKMTGGTIGRVNMKLDDNLFDMSGGTILGNLVTGFGDDTIIVSGGTIGGNISVSGGDDRITVTGGVINGEIRASSGNDRFIWNAGGLIKSSILMGDGNDTAFISHLTEDTLSLTPSVDGGLGNDTLTFDNSSSAGAARYIGWESVNLTNNSRFNLAGDFFLGDSSSGTGSFTIDSTSALQVTHGAVRPYTSGQLTTLTNAGVIDMTSASSSAADTLSVYGNYVGRGGQLLLQTVLGDDSSASDKLIVSQGAISGNTQVGISNLGGQGALTLQNGIEVVQAQNGATSSADAFALKNSVSAGAYQYYLFKGGVTAGSENNWYLRSSVIAIAPRAAPPAAPPVIIRPPSAPPVAPAAPIVAADEPPVEPPTAAPVAPADPPSTVPADSPADASPTPAATTPALPAAVAGAAPIPLFRLEVPVYSVVVPAAQTLMLNALGTFHDRQGDQGLLTETGLASAGWGRFYNNDFKKSWSGTVSPSLDGSLEGFQIGNDLFSSEISEGRYQRFGFFVGQTHLRGSVKGFAEGFQGRQAGQTKLDGDNVGLYWTLSDRSGWYVDAVAIATRLDGNSQSDRGVKLETQGHGLTLSLEGGYPVALSDHWSVEPQAQLISQHISLDDQNDGISEVSFDSQNYTTGRLGARLNGRYRVSNTPVEPYLRANVWRTFGGSDTVTYDDVDRIKTQHKASSADVGMGVVAQLSPTVAVYLGADYDANLDSNDLKGISGNVGIRMSW